MDALTQALENIAQTPQAELPSLVVVVVDDGKIVYEHALGHRSIDPQNPGRNLPANRDTKYRVASISKTVVALAIMQLVERGVLDLDTDVSEYLEFRLRNPHHPEVAITTRHLLTHTSSLRDGSIYSIPLPYQMRDFFVEDGAFYNGGEHFGVPDARIGEYFTYCNLNFGVLGALIEVTSGERFDQYVHAHILQPLGLDASFGVHLLSDEGFANLAGLYRKFDGEAWHPNGAWVAQADDYKGVRPEAIVQVENPDTNDPLADTAVPTLADYVLGQNGTMFSPQGGLRISAPDLATLMQVWLNRGRVGDVQLLQPETIDKMLTVQWRYDAAQANGDPYGGLMRSWGLGLQYTTGTTLDGQGDAIGAPHQGGMWGHGGDAYGLLSGMWFDRDTRKGFVYIMGGVGTNPYQHTGQFSSFFRWEEDIMQAIYQFYFD